MRCIRCDTLMVKEHIVSERFHVEGWFWNCQVCGEFVQIGDSRPLGTESRSSLKEAIIGR